jgi:hypothetical protein
MNFTCCLFARPFPVTDRLMRAGEYSLTGRPPAATAARIAPRAWPSTSAERGLTATKTCSTTTQSGACRVITPATVR